MSIVNTKEIREQMYKTIDKLKLLGTTLTIEEGINHSNNLPKFDKRPTLTKIESKLRTLKLPRGIELLDLVDLVSNESVEYLYVPDTVVHISNTTNLSTFKDLKEVVFDCTLDSLPNSLFRDNLLLEKVILPRGLKSIPTYCFFGLEHLNIECLSIELPDTVQVLERCSFAYSDIKEISLPNSLRRIEQEAFFCCSQLTKLVIPEFVEFIGKEAIYSIIVLEIEGFIEKIDFMAFNRRKIRQIILHKRSMLLTIEKLLVGTKGVEIIILEKE